MFPCRSSASPDACGYPQPEACESQLLSTSDNVSSWFLRQTHRRRQLLTGVATLTHQSCFSSRPHVGCLVRTRGVLVCTSKLKSRVSKPSGRKHRGVAPETDSKPEKAVDEGSQAAGRVQARPSVLTAPRQVLQATSEKHWTPGLLGTRTMGKHSVVFSHGRSGSFVAGSYIMMHQRGRFLVRGLHLPVGVVSPFCALRGSRGSKGFSQPQIGVDSIPKTGVLGHRFLTWAPSRRLEGHQPENWFGYAVNQPEFCKQFQLIGLCIICSGSFLLVLLASPSQERVLRRFPVCSVFPPFRAHKPTVAGNEAGSRGISSEG